MATPRLVPVAGSPGRYRHATPEDTLVPVAGSPGRFRPATPAELARRHAPPAPARPRSFRPRVLLASQYLQRTGAPIILANLAHHLRGFDMTVYSPHDGPLRRDIEGGGVRVTHTLDLTGIDLVVANTIVSAPVVAAAKAANVPCVWLIHESDPAMCGNLPDVLAVLDYPVRVVFPCQATADAYSRWRKAGVEIVPSIIPPVPIVDRAECRKRMGFGDEFVILTMGSNEPRKGQQDLWQATADMGADVKVLFVCGAPDPWSYYAAADLYVCCSRIEAYPLSIQEARAYGLPVITTPVFGCSDLIRDGIDGLHYQPGDVADLRAKIERIRTFDIVRADLSKPLDHLPSFAESLGMYEAVFRHAANVAPLDQPIHVVYHSAGMGDHWRSVVSEQFGQFRDAGLLRILNTHVGEDPQWVIDEAIAFGLDLTMCQYEPDVTHYEKPAMLLIERLSRGSKPVLYVHTKGVSRPAEEPLWTRWRRLMMREVVGRWRENVDALHNHDAVGVNWWTSPGNHHFSGNFWLASAAWLRKLPPFAATYQNRFSCEVWIGQAPNCRAKSLVCRDKRFHAEDAGYLELLMP